MFPKENVEPTAYKSWDQYYNELRDTTGGKLGDLRREVLLWAVVRLLWEILQEMRRER